MKTKRQSPLIDTTTPEAYRSQYLSSMDAAVAALKEAVSIAGRAHKRGKMTDEYRVELSIAVDECREELDALLEKSGFTKE